MNAGLFRGSTSGRVLRAGTGEAAYWAFVPNPLAPRLEFNADLVASLSDADRALGELSGLGRTLANPHLLIGPFIRREAVLSSRIEGTQANAAELYAYEAGQLALPGLKPGRESDAGEVLNYVRALEYGLERIEALPASLRLIRELHARLMQGVRGAEAFPGEFRTTQNWIGPPGCTLSQADFVPPPPPEMRQALAAFESYLHSDDPLPPLVRLALIHYQFEAIHPFVDGNGRIGRLLLSILLVHWRLLPLPLLYLSAYFERHRPAYYELLLAVSQRGAWGEWLAFFLAGVADQSHDAIGRARRLQDLQADWHRRLTGSRTSSLVLRLADSLFLSPVLTIPEAQRRLSVTYRSAQLNVDKLVMSGVLKPAGEARYGKTFYAPAILDIVEATDGE